MADPAADDALDSLLARPVAGRSVGDGIARAISDGRLTPLGHGRWRLNTIPAVPSPWMKQSRDASRHCRFYMGLMFEHVYDRARVPAGCAGCYKVKVLPRSLRELVALREIGRALPHTYKCGLDLRVSSAVPYSGYFYLNGLGAAQAAFARIREAVSAHEKLGPDVSVFVKRGCTEYEIACGPPDRYSFAPAQAEIEAALRARVTRHEPPRPPPAVQTQQTFARWLRTACSIGDETYRDFTGGRRLPPAITHDAP